MFTSVRSHLMTVTLTLSYYIFFQEGINLLHLPFTWRNFIRSPWRVLSASIIVDETVFRLVLSITHDVWLYRYHYMSRWLIRLDRGIDLGAVVFFVFLYHSESAPHWEVYLYVYITLRLVTIALCCATNLCERYLVRTMVLHAASGFCGVAFFAPFVAYESDRGAVIVLVCCLVGFRAVYLVLFIGIYLRMWPE